MCSLCINDIIIQNIAKGNDLSVRLEEDAKEAQRRAAEERVVRII